MPSAPEPQDHPTIESPGGQPPTETGHALWDCLLYYQRTYMALRNFAEATRGGYASDLGLFINYLRDTAGVSTLEGVRRTHLHNYFAELDQRGARASG